MKKGDIIEHTKGLKSDYTHIVREEDGFIGVVVDEEVRDWLSNELRPGIVSVKVLQTTSPSQIGNVYSLEIEYFTVISPESTKVISKGLLKYLKTKAYESRRHS